MKLKQRLLLIPILIFLYLITKPLWSDDEAEPWRHRAHHVGTMVRRNKSDQKYAGAFVGEKVQPSISDIKGGGGGASAPNVLPPNQNNQPRPYPVPNQIIQKPVEPPKPLIPIIPAAESPVVRKPPQIPPKVNSNQSPQKNLS